MHHFSDNLKSFFPPASSLPKFTAQQARNTLAAGYHRGKERQVEKPKLQAHILKHQPNNLSIFWIIYLSIGWGSANSVRFLNKKDCTELPKDGHVRYVLTESAFWALTWVTTSCFLCLCKEHCLPASLLTEGISLLEQIQALLLLAQEIPTISSQDFFNPKQPLSHFFSRRQKMHLFKGPCTYCIKTSKISAGSEEKISGIFISNLDVFMSGTVSSVSEKNGPCCFSVFLLDWKLKEWTKKHPS